MTATTATRPSLRAAPDARPPCQSWQPRLVEPSAQPTLLDEPDPLPYAPTPPGRPAAGRDAADARGWAAALAAAVIQVVQGLRPIAQLTRWVDEQALAEIALRRRQAGSAGLRSGRPGVVRSVRVQHPVPSVAEVCAHLALGTRSVAMAFRLERAGDRWLCTALELAPLGSSAEQQPGLTGG